MFIGDLGLYHYYLSTAPKTFIIVFYTEKTTLAFDVKKSEHTYFNQFLHVWGLCAFLVAVERSENTNQIAECKLKLR